MTLKIVKGKEAIKRAIYKNKCDIYVEVTGRI